MPKETPEFDAYELNKLGKLGRRYPEYSDAKKLYEVHCDGYVLSDGQIRFLWAKKRELQDMGDEL